jgi:phenylacetic acid degradation protein
MDEAEIGENSIIGALCFIKAKEVIPPRSMVVGNPSRIVKEVSDDMINWKSEGTKLYQSLAKEYNETLKECEPLTEIESSNFENDYDYKIWKK